ncbi:hypothetical protein Ciccas_012923, partial [Cichlidogyrus casuarinus]
TLGLYACVGYDSRKETGRGERLPTSHRLSLDIGYPSDGTGSRHAEAVLKVLEQHQFKESLLAIVTDGPSTNTGFDKGSDSILEQKPEQAATENRLLHLVPGAKQGNFLEFEKFWTV